MGLYQKHRPDSFDKLHGQDAAVKSVRKMLKDGSVPHAILISGPSGCGKTTIARILKKELNCSDNDFCEMNCADVRGIDNIRELKERMSRAPWGGDCRIYLIDEAHGLTKDAQDALLKTLEDTPSHVYFVLATTNPAKLLPTIRNRCTPIAVKSLGESDVKNVVSSVLKAEGLKPSCLTDEVLEKLIETADGSARKALVILEQVLTLDDEDEQLKVISSADAKEEAIAICRELVKPKPRWSDVAKVIREVEGDAEGIRQLILSYFTSCLLKGSGNSARFAHVLECFQFDYYTTGRAGLALSAFQACSPS